MSSFVVMHARTTPLALRTSVTVIATSPALGGVAPVKATALTAIAKAETGFIETSPSIRGLFRTAYPRTGNRGRNCKHTARGAARDGWRLSPNSQTLSERASAGTSPTPCDW